MKVHLRYTHRKELVTHLPLRGKGFNMDYRTHLSLANIVIPPHKWRAERELHK